MDPEAAARTIVAWVEKRYGKVFWYCKWCVRSGFAFREHHGRISNYGVCETCHNEHDEEERQYEAACGNCGDCYVCHGNAVYLNYVRKYEARRALRWVGPRMERERKRVSALMEKRPHDE